MSRETKSADCAEYRYLLPRDLGSLLTLEAPRRVLFCMLNPSTATADTDDATIRRAIRFAAREEATELAVVNLFATRATDPRMLPTFDDPVGPDNDTVIEQKAADAYLIIAAWEYCPRRRRKDVPKRSSTCSHDTPTSTAWANPRPLATRATRSTCRPTRPGAFTPHAGAELSAATTPTDRPRNIQCAHRAP